MTDTPEKVPLFVEYRGPHEECTPTKKAENLQDAQQIAEFARGLAADIYRKAKFARNSAGASIDDYLDSWGRWDEPRPATMEEMERLQEERIRDLVETQDETNAALCRIATQLDDLLALIGTRLPIKETFQEGGRITIAKAQEIRAANGGRLGEAEYSAAIPEEYQYCSGWADDEGDPLDGLPEVAGEAVFFEKGGFSEQGREICREALKLVFPAVEAYSQKMIFIIYHAVVPVARQFSGDWVELSHFVPMEEGGPFDSNTHIEVSENEWAEAYAKLLGRIKLADDYDVMQSAAQ